MAFLDPNHVLKQFGVYGAQDVADFGVGGGHITLAAAKRLEGGNVYAVDLEKEILSRLVAEAKLRGHANIHPLWGDFSQSRGVPLKDESLDRIIIANCIHGIDDRNGMILEAKRLLRPHGKVLLIEWQDNAQGGPHPKHKVNEDVALSLFGRHGFKKESTIDAGEYHYGMILVR